MPTGGSGVPSGRAAPVLIVEDDRDIREALAELLRDEGYDCFFAGDGLEALEALRLQTPSLVLVDLLMPQMNGAELIVRLRRDPRWRTLPIIVMTAGGERIIGVELESLDALVLQKPVDPATLTQMLARYSGASSDMCEGA